MKELTSEIISFSTYFVLVDHVSHIVLKLRVTLRMNVFSESVDDHHHCSWESDDLRYF